MQHEEILHRCFRCGYCKLPENYIDFNCPPYLAFRFETYSPGGRMWLIRALLDNKVAPSARLQEILFSCVACANCVVHCTFPKFKDQLLLAITAAKEQLVNDGRVPPAVRDCLTRIYQHGNPYGRAGKKRDAWKEQMAVAEYSDQEFLFFVGDVGSYDTRGQEIARSVAGLLQRLGVSFGILGAQEISDGNEAAAMGESELFKYLAEENIKTFRSRGVEKIIALSPHGYNALKNEYPRFGGQYPVMHYSQIIAPLLKKAAFAADPPPLRVTYHDSCYLGRHNMEYNAPRKVLATLPGVEMVEMQRCFQNALCCGGGGGNVFTDVIGSGRQTSAGERVREAAATGAAVLAVACPQCAVMFADAVKVQNLEDRLEVKEISEIVNERIA